MRNGFWYLWCKGDAVIQGKFIYDVKINQNSSPAIEAERKKEGLIRYPVFITGAYFDADQL